MKRTFAYSAVFSLLALSSHFAAAADRASDVEGIPLSNLQEFVEVIEQVKTYYVEDVSNNELFDNAIGGMVGGLDPYSAYLDEADFDDLKINTTGKFGGLGIEVSMKDGFVQVISPIDDTPAAKAGIHAGDMIVRINDKLVKGMTLREAVSEMRGSEGSKVKLTVMREDSPKPKEFVLERDIIKVQNVKYAMLEPGYGYVRLTHFQENTAKDMHHAIHKLKRESGGELKGMVLDLRNNPGGVLDAAVDVSDTFLDADNLEYNGVIVFTRSRIKQSRIVDVARTSDMLNEAPLVILVNEGSASASEIVAGALQDHQRAIIVGTKTFGKGSVQTVIPLEDNKALKLTTAYYYTPSGRSIQSEGIEPDIMIESPEAMDQKKLLQNDLQLDEAVTVLKTLAVNR